MPPLLVCSLGNPGAAYANTLHSAGHVVLNALIRHLSAPAPARVSGFGKGLVSTLSPHTFYLSPAYMNESGPGVASAWRTFKSSLPIDSLEPRLVILHDEIEAKIGSFKVKKDTVGGSARGHNGLKSLLAMPGMGREKITRVGVGIGPRPVSREPKDVAEFVLRKMTAGEKERVEGCAESVWRGLGG